MAVTSIPVIDIAPYLEGSEAGRRKVAEEVNRACQEIGFFLIKGHGVPQDTIDQTYAKAAEFFRLPARTSCRSRRRRPTSPGATRRSRARRSRRDSARRHRPTSKR